MAKAIKLSDLSEEDLKKLKEQALAEQEEQKNNIRKQRKEYKNLVNETIPVLFKELVSIAEKLSSVKKKVYDDLEALVQLKAVAYDREGKDDQYTHSFTTDDGLTIIIGHRLNDGWDDTVETGIKKVHEYLDGLGTDQKSKRLVTTILQLLSKDSKGTLKASRVLQLKKLADDIGDAVFIDAITIIQDAYRPVKSKAFVTARYSNAAGDKIEVPLDISTAGEDFKYEPINPEV